jgi:hypothetical protein
MASGSSDGVSSPSADPSVLLDKKRRTPGPARQQQRSGVDDLTRGASAPTMHAGVPEFRVVSRRIRAPVCCECVQRRASSDACLGRTPSEVAKLVLLDLIFRQTVVWYFLFSFPCFSKASERELLEGLSLLYQSPSFFHLLPVMAHRSGMTCMVEGSLLLPGFQHDCTVEAVPCCHWATC